MSSLSYVPVEPYSADSDWRYRAEGGANIVISMPHQGRVLRFPKTAHAEPIQVARLRRLADYRNFVIAPLLGELGGSPWQVVRLSEEDRRRLATDIEPSRPPRRRGNAINPGGLALKMDDCAVFPSPAAPLAPPTAPPHVFSVEIKAKQGFLCADDDLGVCSFCMKQYLKLKRGTVQQVSGYCPLDLFSGEFDRFDRALRSLLDSPQNNLRVFLDGEFVYGAGARGDRDQLLDAVAEVMAERRPPQADRLLKLWTRLMFTVLCTNDSQSVLQEEEEDEESCRPAGCCVPGAGLPPRSFLGRVLRGQRLAAAGPTQTSQLLDQMTAAEPNRVEEAFRTPFSDPLWTRVVADADIEPVDALEALQRYSIGATMRDASLMITMRRASDGEVDAGLRQVTDSAGHRWVVLCRLMDLDPKHVRRVSRQRLKKEKSKELYLRARHPRGEANRGVPIPCSVSDEGIDHLLAVSGSPM
ncbi:inositol-pentakisphosphate 2-kinase-like [Amphibalanus amphitrite]|nr:inositol-pentakisphosphate 2-kinase-like [Amphibalanus amphitrite]